MREDIPNPSSNICWELIECSPQYLITWRNSMNQIGERNMVTSYFTRNFFSSNFTENIGDTQTQKENFPLYDYQLDFNMHWIAYTVTRNLNISLIRHNNWNMIYYTVPQPTADWKQLNRWWCLEKDCCFRCSLFNLLILSLFWHLFLTLRIYVWTRKRFRVTIMRVAQLYKLANIC